MWIDAFFFRASAMLPSDKHMLLNLEQVASQMTVGPSSSTTLSGFINYTAVTANEKLASQLFCFTGIYRSTHRSLEIFLSDPIPAKFRTMLPTGFFVVEAKSDSLHLTAHLPQAISEIYMCAKYLRWGPFLVLVFFYNPLSHPRKDILRGALTDGHA